MAKLSMLMLLFTHPGEFRTLLQFWLFHAQKRDITSQREHSTSGWDRASMRRCWGFLDMTSTTFASLIKELDGDLAQMVCIFYLVLRGLDTIEDDMTISDDIKQPILRTFHQKAVTPGWNYTLSGPDEKDRSLLVEFDVVVEEVNRLSPEYRNIILDICSKMQTGMADYAHKAATTDSLSVETVAEYDLYCHYVSGLVGEGLSRMWSASGKEAESLQFQLELSNSMGLFLQKASVIRDYREDTDALRFFWPREIWGQYGFKEMKEMYEPGNEQRAQWVQTGMIVDALRHATDSLDYLQLLRNQSIFKFFAIVFSMAMETFNLSFMNKEMFHHNLKIRKAAAAELIMLSTNPRDVAYSFRKIARSIHSRALPSDPNFLRLGVACGKIEQWCEHNYPSFVTVSKGPTPVQSHKADDARSRIMLAEEKIDKDISMDPSQSATNAQAWLAEVHSWKLIGFIAAAFIPLIGLCLVVV